MVGTILKDDLQSSIEDQLQNYARGLQQTGQGVGQQVGDTLEDLQRAGRAKLQDVQNLLSDYATQQYNAQQEAQRLAEQQRQQQQAAVQQQLSDYATQLQQPQQTQPGVAQPADVAGVAPQPAAMPHSEEPATASDQRLGSKWKTQFDFGATYTGDYRTGTPHRGVDLVPSNGQGIGTEVDAFAPGTVTNVFRDPGGAGGLIVYVKDADGLTHAYMHLNSANVQVGQHVDRGTQIATMGESGTEGSPHLHYEVRKNEASGDPLDQLIDPRPYEAGTRQPTGGPQGAVANAATQVTTTAQNVVGQAVQGASDRVRGQWDAITKAAQSTGVPQAVISAIMDTENGGPRSESSAGALGFMQVLRSWFKPGEDPFDPLTNITRGAEILRDNFSRWGSWDKAAAAYFGAIDNQGNITGARDATGTSGNQYVNTFQNNLQKYGGAGPLGEDQGNPPPMYVGDQTAPQAKPPIVSNTPEAQSPMAQLQGLQDQLDALRNQLIQVNKPPLAEGAPARQAIGQTFSDIGSGAQSLYQQAYGTPEQAQARQQQQLAEIQRLNEESNRRATEQVQNLPGSLPGIVAGGIWNVFANPSMGITWDQYQAQQSAKNKWIEDNNPARDVLLVGGLTSGIAQQLTDPLQVLTFGPTFGAGRAIGAGLGETIAQQAGRVLTPEATRFVSGVAERLTSGALANGVQNLLFDAERPDSTLESKVQAFASGAALGGLMDVTTPPVRDALAKVLRPTLERLPELLRARQRGEVDLGLITTGEPTERPTPPRPPDRIVEPLMLPNVTREPSAPPERPVAGVQRLPTYLPAGAPEAGFEALARQSREAAPDNRAHIDLNTVPKDILPFTADPLEAQQEGMVKLNPGGMPHTDDLRALWEANQHKRSFYTDQGDEAANIVGPDNTGEFFTLNAINSILTRVNSQVAESIQAAGLVRKVAREGRAAGLSASEIRQNILDAIADPKQNPITGKAVNAKRNSQIEGYSTGGAPVTSGAKTSSFAGNYTSAEGRFFDPRITNDLHNWRLMNVSADEIPSLRKNQRTGEMEWFIDRPHEQNVANNDRAYRGTESVIGELAREYGVDGYAMQSGLWDGMRSIQRDPEVLRLWQQGHFRDAIELGKQRDLFRAVNPDMEFSGDVKQVMDSMPVRRALEQYGQYLKDPLPPELGISGVERTYRGKRLGRSSKTSPAAKPSNLAFREEQRPYAEASAPLVQGLDQATAERLGYDPQRGIFPWLEASHRVVPVAPDEYAVHLPAGNEDTARYVAAQVGQASNAERVRIHVPDYRAGDIVGVGARGTPDQVGRLQAALDNMGITSIVGTGKRSLQVPLERVGDTRTLNAVQDAAISIGFPEDQVGTYTGRTSDVPRSAYAATSAELAPTFAPTSAERSDLLQRGLGAVPAQRGPPAVVRGRQRGESYLPFTLNVGGAVAGGYAGNVATPESASPEERLRNIGLGATAGLLGTAAITRGGLRPALERAGRESEGFRAPEARQGPELRATTQEPPGGPTERPTTVGGREPRSLEEVHSNPYALREAQPNETPMTPDEMFDYGGELEQRMQDVQNRRDAIDEAIRNPGQKIERPRWAGGLTNLQVAEIARRAGASPYEEGWYDRVGLEQGSGEVRDVLRESGITDIPKLRQRELSPAELRAERTRLDREIQDITSAYDQMTNAPAEPNLVRVQGAEEAARAAAPEPLPFDTGAPEPVTPGEAQGGMDEGARLAQEIVLSKGRGTIRSGVGTVSGEFGRVRATALVSSEAIKRATETPPSARTAANMPNLDALLEGEPEIAAQIRQAAEDNPDLFEAYRQGVISMDSLRNDLAKRVGMTVQDWNKTKIGQGFNPEELMALQAAAVEQAGRMMDTAEAIIAKGGVDNLSPEELVFSAGTLADANKILAVARGGRTTAGRTLNALKQRFDRTLASDITAANERKAAQQTAQQARRAAARATTVLAKGRELEREATTAKAEASRNGAPKNILEQIDQAYAELDRYNAMTLHEKGAEFDRLKAERAAAAANRKAKVRSAPEELLSALRAELKAEQDNFAKRKDTWETMAFWDSKQFENAMAKRTAFRGQLYIEQQRKVANIAAKQAEKDAARAFDQELQRRGNQQAKAEKLLEAIGGREVTTDMLRNFVAAMADPAPDAAAKFLKGMAKPSNWARASIIRLAGLLSGPITHAANMGGNTARAVVEVPVHATAIGIDAARAAVTGGERQAYMAELLPMVKAWSPGFYAQLPNALRVLKTGIDPREAADLSKVRAGFGVNPVVDATMEMPLRALKAEDVLFRGAAYAMHAQRVATREAIKEGFTGAARDGRVATILKNLEEYPDLAKEAEDAAAHMVFQEKRNLPLPRTMPGRNLATSEAGTFARSQILPFMETPANITAQGAGMTPLGFMSTYEAARGTREMPVGTRAERYARGRQVLLAEERAARAIVGTGILGAGIYLGMQGMLTGAYSEDPNVNSTYPQGWRPWSFRIEDPVSKNTYYVPLQNMALIGFPLAMAAIITDPVHRGKSIMDPEEFGMAASGIGKYILDNTFLQGMSDFVDMLQDPNARGGKFWESLAASYGPYSALGREMQRATGVATRNPREGIRGLIDAMEANYPGLSGNVPPSLTPMGEERTQGATGLGRYVVPGRYDIERDEPTLAALREAGVGIPAQPRAVNVGRGWSIDLTEDERAQLQQARGAAIRDQVAQTMALPIWQQATRTDRNAMLRRAVSNAGQNTNILWLRTLSDADIQGRAKQREVPDPYILGAA